MTEAGILKSYIKSQEKEIEELKLLVWWLRYQHKDYTSDVKIRETAKEGL